MLHLQGLLMQMETRFKNFVPLKALGKRRFHEIALYFTFVAIAARH